MELFTASVEDPDRAERLRSAIKGRGAFRHFKDELVRSPGELERRHALSEEASAAEPGHGSPRPATACSPRTTTIPETGSSPRHRPELTHGSTPEPKRSIPTPDHSHHRRHAAWATSRPSIERDSGFVASWAVSSRLLLFGVAAGDGGVPIRCRVSD